MSYVNSLAQSNYLQYVMGTQQKAITKLQAQVASGNKANDFSGYTPTEGRLAISLTNALMRNKQYQQTVTLLSTQAELAEASLTKTHSTLIDVSKTVVASYLNVADTSNNAAGAIQQSARHALEAIIGFYNQNMTGGYVFAGRGSQPPLRDAGLISNNVRAAINSAKLAPPAVAGNFVNGKDATIAVNSVFLDPSPANRNNLNQANLSQWFSSGSVNDRPSEAIPISDNQTLAVDVSALPNLQRIGPIDAKTGLMVDPTYGIMDSIRALSAIATVEMNDFGTGSDAPFKYQEFLLDQVNHLSVADREINTMTAMNGNNRQLLQNTGSLLQSQSITLQSSIASDESVDQATAITNLQNLQTQLSATYQVTSLLKNLSLVNFLR